MKRQGYDAQQIAIAIDKASVAIPEGELVQPDYPETPDAPNPFAQDDYFAEQSGGADDFVDNLTEEDKKYLPHFATNFVYTKKPTANNTKIIKIVQHGNKGFCPFFIMDY